MRDAPTNQQLGTALAEILNHPYVTGHQGNDFDRPGCAGLWALRQGNIHANETRALLAVAFAEELAPPDLRMLIGDYMIKHFGSVVPPTDDEHDTDQIHKARRFALAILEQAMEQLANLGATPAAIIDRALVHFDVGLDGDLIDEIEEIRLASTDQEDEDEDQEDDEEVSDIIAALSKVRQEYANGTLTPEREALITSLFGEYFFVGPEEILRAEGEVAILKGKPVPPGSA